MLIKNMIEDLGAPGEEAIPIMNVSRNVISQPSHALNAKLSSGV